MEFLTPPKRTPEPVPAEVETLAERDGDSAATTAVTIAPASLARSVLPRIVSVLAARANFSTDRISDAQLVADALAAHAPSSLGADQISLTIAVQSRSLRLCVGPLGAGRADQLILDSDVQGLGPVIEKLTDERRVAAVGSEEVLALQLTDRA
jgi:hypothetical protein